MKKLMSAVLAAVMLLAFGMQTFASPSVSGVVDEGQVYSNQGSVTWDKIAAGAVSQEAMNVVNAINNAGTSSSVKTALGSLISLTGIKLFDEDSSYVEDADSYLENMFFLSSARMLNFHDGEPSADDPARVTFTANNMTDTMNVYVLYYCPEHGWELLETTRTAGNQVTACFHSGPGIAVLVYMDEGVLADGSEGVSPKMGDNTAAASMSVAAVLLILFGIYAIKRSRRNA